MALTTTWQEALTVEALLIGTYYYLTGSSASGGSPHWHLLLPGRKLCQWRISSLALTTTWQEALTVEALLIGTYYYLAGSSDSGGSPHWHLLLPGRKLCQWRISSLTLTTTWQEALTVEALLIGTYYYLAGSSASGGSPHWHLLLPGRKLCQWRLSSLTLTTTWQEALPVEDLLIGTYYYLAGSSDSGGSPHWHLLLPGRKLCQWRLSSLALTTTWQEALTVEDLLIGTYYYLAGSSDSGGSPHWHLLLPGRKLEAQRGVSRVPAVRRRRHGRHPQAHQH